MIILLSILLIIASVSCLVVVRLWRESKRFSDYLFNLYNGKCHAATYPKNNWYATKAVNGDIIVKREEEIDDTIFTVVAKIYKTDGYDCTYEYNCAEELVEKLNENI